MGFSMEKCDVHFFGDSRESVELLCMAASLEEAISRGFVMWTSPVQSFLRFRAKSAKVVGRLQGPASDPFYRAPAYQVRCNDITRKVMGNGNGHTMQEH